MASASGQWPESHGAGRGPEQGGSPRSLFHTYDSCTIYHLFSPPMSLEQHTDTSRLLRLHQNEAPWGPPAAAISRLLAAISRTHLYPIRATESANGEAATYFGVTGGNAVLTTGVDEATDLCLLEFNHLLTVTPGFYGFADRAKALGVASETFVLDGWEGIPRGLLAAALPGTLVILASPNNPTGLSFREHDLFAILERGCHLLIDHTYADFAGISPTMSGSWLDRSDRILVFRSFSKSFALAGLRVGCLLGSETLIQKLRSRQPFHSVDRLAVEAVGAVIEDDPEFPERLAARIQPLRDALTTMLRESGLFAAVLNSCANFVLAVCDQSQKAVLIRDSLRDTAGILVALGAPLGVPSALRITVPDEVGLARVHAALTSIGSSCRREVGM